MGSSSLCLTHDVKDTIQPFIRSSMQVVGGSLLIALCSQIKIVLPFTIVPLTFQTLAILLLGSLFGSKRASLMVLAYFGEILMGMPVLAGGISNPLAFIGPKAGYIIGFLIQAYWMGWWTERSSSFNPKVAILAGLSACCLQLSLGTCWLANFVGWEASFMMGFVPFILGEALKVCAAVSIAKNFSFLLKR